MAQYDLPAAFEYIARSTNKKIHYIGHSQGTMIMFAALA
jgi:esterase/lipase superfamily enzyme